MNGVQYRKLVGDARAFRQSAWLMEDEIHRLKVRHGDLTPIGGATGWPSHYVWESLKTASHFNLFISFELRLKCLLALQGHAQVLGREGHLLAKLYDRLPLDTAKKLEDLFREALHDRSFTLIAFLDTDTADVPSTPANRDLHTLKDFCGYLDEDAKLWNKRYSHETVSRGPWRHYLDNLEPLLLFLDKTEALGEELARKKKIIK